jgi:hypothetical protein
LIRTRQTGLGARLESDSSLLRSSSLSPSTLPLASQSQVYSSTATDDGVVESTSTVIIVDASLLCDKCKDYGGDRTLLCDTCQAIPEPEKKESTTIDTATTATTDTEAPHVSTTTNVDTLASTTATDSGTPPITVRHGKIGDVLAKLRARRVMIAPSARERLAAEEEEESGDNDMYEASDVQDEDKQVVKASRAIIPKNLPAPKLGRGFGGAGASGFIIGGNSSSFIIEAPEPVVAASSDSKRSSGAAGGIAAVNETTKISLVTAYSSKRKEKQQKEEAETAAMLEAAERREVEEAEVRQHARELRKARAKRLADTGTEQTPGMDGKRRYGPERATIIVESSEPQDDDVNDTSTATNAAATTAVVAETKPVGIPGLPNDGDTIEETQQEDDPDVVYDVIGSDPAAASYRAELARKAEEREKKRVAEEAEEEEATTMELTDDDASASSSVMVTELQPVIDTVVSTTSSESSQTETQSTPTTTSVSRAAVVSAVPVVASRVIATSTTVTHVSSIDVPTKAVLPSTLITSASDSKRSSVAIDNDNVIAEKDDRPVAKYSSAAWASFNRKSAAVVSSTSLLIDSSSSSSKKENWSNFTTSTSSSSFPTSTTGTNAAVSSNVVKITTSPTSVRIAASLPSVPSASQSQSSSSSIVSLIDWDDDLEAEFSQPIIAQHTAHTKNTKPSATIPLTPPLPTLTKRVVVAPSNIASKSTVAGRTAHANNNNRSNANLSSGRASVPATNRPPAPTPLPLPQRNNNKQYHQQRVIPSAPIAKPSGGSAPDDSLLTITF